jgi:catechol 2,3-dioxygenase-like lactoylglutathione lyase family enzyme
MPLVSHGVVETALYAVNLELAERFYAEVLGLRLIRREPGRHVFFAAGPATVLLLFDPHATQAGEALPGHGAHGPGHAALGIGAEDLDSWRTHLLSQGVAIEREHHWPLGGRSLYFRDPAGNLLELITPGAWGLPSGW